MLWFERWLVGQRKIIYTCPKDFLPEDELLGEGPFSAYIFLLPWVVLCTDKFFATTQGKERWALCLSSMDSFSEFWNTQPPGSKVKNSRPVGGLNTTHWAPATKSNDMSSKTEPWSQHAYCHTYAHKHAHTIQEVDDKLWNKDTPLWDFCFWTDFLFCKVMFANCSSVQACLWIHANRQVRRILPHKMGPCTSTQGMCGNERQKRE